METHSNEPPVRQPQATADNPASGDDREVIAALRRLVAEEMFLLGQELEDSLDASQRTRLAELSASLDDVCELMASHRSTRRRPPG